MVIAQVCGMRIIPATYSYEQRIPGRSTATFVKGGKVHRRNGFGGEQVYSATRLVLDVAVDGRMEEVFIDKLFRSEIGNLTAKRVAAIFKAAPDRVALEKCESFNGFVYFVLTDDTFEE